MKKIKITILSFTVLLATLLTFGLFNNIEKVYADNNVLQVSYNSQGQPVNYAMIPRSSNLSTITANTSSGIELYSSSGGTSSIAINDVLTVTVLKKVYVRMTVTNSIPPNGTQLIGEALEIGDTFQIKVSSSKTMILTGDIDLDPPYEGVFDFYFDVVQSDNTRPVVSGEENFVTNVDDARPLSFFQAFLTAWDETDGDVTSRITVKTDNYTPNISVLGSHKVIWKVDDLSGNETEFEAYIRVVDITAPIINGSTATAEIGYKETWNITNFKTTLTVTDNYDTLTHTDITVKSDGYTSNKSNLGTYTVVYAVKDSSNNEGTFEKKVKVIDNVKPTFSGPTTIATSNNTILTEAEVRAQLTANDEIDGNVTSKITLLEDNYTGKGNKVGSYTITYQVKDNANNTATHIVTITRSDKIPPVIWIQDGVSIKTTPTTPLTFEQIINILTATGQIQVQGNMQYRLLLDEYTGHEDQPGIYAMSIEASSTNGNQSIHNLALTVLAVEDEVPTITDTASTWFKDNWYWLVGGLFIVVAIGYFYTKRK